MLEQRNAQRLVRTVADRLGLCVLTLICALLAQAITPAAAGAVDLPRIQMDQTNAAFFSKYCVQCHGPEEQNGKVRLDNVSFDLGADIQTADTWQKILNALNSGAMPPEYEPQPSNDEKAAFLEELSEKMVEARERLADPGGVSVMRRLNRREYQNTIRDLLGVTIDVSDLPSDAGTGSFDTVGSSLFFSPDQFERYLRLGRQALDEVIVSEQPPQSSTLRTEVEDAARRKADEFVVGYRDGLARYEAWMATNGKQPATDFGFLDEPRARRAKKLYDKNAPYYDAYQTWPHTDTGTYFNQIHSTIAAGFSAEQPPGDYLVRIRIGATDGAPANRRFIEFGRVVDVGGRTDFAVSSVHQITATIDQPQVVEVPVTLTKSGNRDFHFREMRPDHQMANFRKDPDVPDPVLWIDWVEVEGPTVAQWPPENYRRIFFAHQKRKHDAVYAREIIARFAKSAFRGSDPEPQYLDHLVGIYQQRQDAGNSFEDAVGEALAVVLASPQFLYLSEPGAEGGELTDLELATRLSYFLWSAPPDEILLAAAHDGRLSQPDSLRVQTERMLDDPKSRQFITGFTQQWLDLDRIDLFQFDKELYPDFDESTKLAAVAEVYHFVETVLRENLSARELLKSDFVVVNGLLAQYYGIEGVTGEAWRRVPAPPERGGLLSMVAILAMGSDGERTNPVERGAFVLRKLLDDPPPPAPANVPQLSRLDDEVLTTRERLGAHQEQAQCMHCHRKIDPLGFGLENFDAAGHWRTEETLFKVSYNKNNKRKTSAAGTRPIDASGQLHNGPAFDDYYQLREILATRTDAFSRGLIEALLQYGLGRAVSFSDEELINRLHHEMQGDDYRVRSLIHLIVQSEAFRTR